MNRILPYLAVGSLRDTQDASLLAAHHITAVLSLAHPVTHTGLECRYMPLDDGVALRESNVQKTVALVREQKEKGGTTLVACALGISRSVALATAAVKEIENLDLLTAYCVVKRARPEAQPHVILWQSLCRLYGEEIPYLTMLRCDGAGGLSNPGSLYGKS